MPKRTPKSAEPSIKTNASLEELKVTAKKCQACDLWKHATQTVVGEGLPNATIILIGEQPGNHEDLEGKPFVGPAGQLLDEALAEAGIDRKKVYVTNAVKHFKWEPRGKRRIHKKLDAGEIAACRPWLNCRNRCAPSENNRLPWRHRSASATRQRLSRHPTSRRVP